MKLPPRPPLKRRTTSVTAVTVDNLYEVGAFLPESEVDDGHVLPFVSQALAAYKKLDETAHLPSLTDIGAEISNFSDASLQSQFEEFQKTCRSNGRSLKYARMCISPNSSFPLHAHPNIEMIMVVRGRLYERRLTGEPPFMGEFGEKYPTDLSQLDQDAFETKSHDQGSFLFNEIGSVHRSYTKTDHAHLFILWGGGHCDVPVSFTPTFERINHVPGPTLVRRVSSTSGSTTALTQEEPELVNNSCSAWLANSIAETGVKVVYGGHGGALVPLVNAIDEHPDLTWVCTRNEANASLMAAAHAKLTGNLACVIATSGPGATNLTTGLLDAAYDRVPVLAVTGLKPRQGMHFSEFQDGDQSRLFMAGGLEFSHDVASPEALVPLLRDAVAMATTRNTCAHLAIPVDVQAADCPIPVNRPFCAAGAAVRVAPSINIDSLTIDKIVDELKLDTKKVLIAVGLRAVNAGDSILRLAETLHAPIVTRLDAKGTIDEYHPLVIGIEGVHGKPGMEISVTLMETADIVLTFGVDDVTLLICNTAGLQVREMIEFETTALMVNTRYRALHTCVGDLSSIANALASRYVAATGRRLSTLEKLQDSIVDSTMKTLNGAQLGGTDLEVGKLSKSRAGRAAILWNAVHSGGWKGKTYQCHELLTERQRTYVHNAQYAHPAQVLMEVSLRLQKDCVVCVDTGDITLWAGLCLKLKGGMRTLSSEHMGTMGYSLCAGIASIMAREPPATSLVLAGDGGFQMTLNELATFSQHKRPGDRLIVIVFDNQLLGRVIFGFDGALGCELTGPDFASLGRAYGGVGERLTDAKKISEYVGNAKEGLTLLHVPIDPHLKADMATFKDSASNMMNSG